MVGKTIKITTVNNAIFAESQINGGSFNYWKIINEHAGKYLVEHKGAKSFITKEELEKGEKVIEPSLSIPTGMKLKLEVVEK